LIAKTIHSPAGGAKKPARFDLADDPR